MYLNIAAVVRVVTGQVPGEGVRRFAFKVIWGPNQRYRNSRVVEYVYVVFPSATAKLTC